MQHESGCVLGICNLPEYQLHETNATPIPNLRLSESRRAQFVCAFLDPWVTEQTKKEAVWKEKTCHSELNSESYSLAC